MQQAGRLASRLEACAGGGGGGGGGAGGAMEMDDFVGRLDGVLRRLEKRAGLASPPAAAPGGCRVEGAAAEGEEEEEDAFPGVSELPAEVFDGVCRGDAAAVDSWLDSGGDIDARSAAGETMLMGASLRAVYRSTAAPGHAPVASRQPRIIDGPCGACRSRYGQEALVTGLVEIGADIDAATGKGGTALMAAACVGLAPTVKMLIKAAAQHSVQHSVQPRL